MPRSSAPLPAVKTRQAERVPCAEASQQRREDTAGTLGYFDVGMFVEGVAPFPRLALASLSPALYEFNVATWQRYQTDGHGLHPRILPIRRQRHGHGGHERSEKLTVLFSLPVADGRPLQLRYEIADYDALLDFDLAAMRDVPLDYAEHRDDAFRLLVCTHGKVDPCCAVHGNALYRHVRRRGDVELWHGAHFGGCRFAGNVWCLPSGNCYGHVSVADIDELIDAERAGRMFQKGYRGRIGQSMTEAAGEWLIRQRHGLWGVGDVAVARCGPATESSQRLRVRTPDGERLVSLRFAPEGDAHFMTCRATEARPVLAYSLQAA